MTEEEQKDIQQLRADIQQQKVVCFDYMDHLSQLDDRQLALSGHRKGTAQAVFDTLLSYQKNIEKLRALYLKKYPD